VKTTAKALKDLMDTSGHLWALVKSRQDKSFGYEVFFFEENGKRLTYKESLQRALDELEKSLEEAGETYYLTFQQEK
jgi:hypothetical protein